MVLRKSWLSSVLAILALLVAACDARAVDCKSVDDWKARPTTLGGSAQPAPANLSPALQAVSAEQLKVLAAARTRLAEVALSKPYVVICDFETINARAFGRGPNIPPAGIIMITTAMMEVIGADESKAASVLAHEIAHIIEEHGEQRVRFARVAARQAVAAGVASEGQQSGVGILVARQVFAANFAAYSRDIERRADEVGYQMYKAAGYDPREATRAFEALRQVVGDRAQGYLDSHPGLNERIANVVALARDDAKRVQTIDNAKAIAGESERYRAIADAHMENRRWGELAALVKSWLDVLPQSGLGWYYRGVLLQRSAKSKALAWEAFAKAAEFDPERPEIWDALVESLLAGGYRREAVACLSAMNEYGLPTEDLRSRVFGDRVFVHGVQRSSGSNLQWGRLPDGRRVISNDPTIFSVHGIEGQPIPPAWMPAK